MYNYMNFKTKLFLPICDQAIWPPFTTISGLAPNSAGFHRTKSASFPT